MEKILLVTLSLFLLATIMVTCMNQSSGFASGKVVRIDLQNVASCGSTTTYRIIYFESGKIVSLNQSDWVNPGVGVNIKVGRNIILKKTDVSACDNNYNKYEVIILDDSEID